jgi:Amt family ammonium transporter
VGAKGALYGDWNQLWIQFIATVATIAFSALMTWVLFNLVDKLVGIRVSEIEESIGLDISEHGEIAYE